LRRALPGASRPNASRNAEGPALGSGNMRCHRPRAPEFGAIGIGTEPGGGEDRVGGMIVVAGERPVRLAGEVGERRIERHRVAHLAEALADAGSAGGDRGVDFDDYRTLLGQRIEWPDGHAAGEAVQYAHAGEARLADLRRADEVEAARRGQAHCALAVLANTHSACAAGEQVAAIAMLAEMAADFRVGQQAGDGEMRIGGRGIVDHLP